MKFKKEVELEVKPLTSKMKMVVALLEEKVSREYGISIEEVRSKKIEIINSKLTIK